MFTSSTKGEIRHFHVVVVKRWQTNVQKSVMHEQSCCFANQAYCFFVVLVAVTVVVAQAPYNVSVYWSENLFYSSAIPRDADVYGKANFAQIMKIVKKDHFFNILLFHF